MQCVYIKCLLNMYISILCGTQSFFLTKKLPVICIFSEFILFFYLYRQRSNSALICSLLFNFDAKNVLLISVGLSGLGKIIKCNKNRENLSEFEFCLISKVIYGKTMYQPRNFESHHFR